MLPDIITCAAAWQLYADFHAGLLQQCIELRIRKITEALSQNIHAAIALLWLHNALAGSNGTFEAGEMVLAFKVLGMHRHYRNAVLLCQLLGNGIIIIPDNLNDAGSHKHYAFRPILRYNFFERLVHAFGTSEGYIMAVEHYRNTAPVNTAVAIAESQALGIIAAFVRTYDNQQAVLDAAGNHSSAHQRAVGTGKKRCCQLRNVLNRLHLAQTIQTS